MKLSFTQPRVRNEWVVVRSKNAPQIQAKLHNFAKSIMAVAFEVKCTNELKVLHIYSIDHYNQSHTFMLS